MLMKAIVYTRYGPPSNLRFKEIQKPDPKAGEVLIKVQATSVNRTDNATIKALPIFARLLTGLLRPKNQTPGTEFSGDIEALGSEVTTLNVGDRVFGFNDMGAKSHAQYLVIDVNSVLTMPAAISYERAACSFEGAHYAYNFLNKVAFEKGQKVLVNGASGAIGSAAVQLLKHFGLTVIAVCGKRNLELVKSLGADEVIDYTTTDFINRDELYDFVFDTVGKSSFFKCKHLLKPGGCYISSDLGYMWQNMFLPLLTPILKPLLGNRRSISPIPLDIRKSMLLIKKLIENGEFMPVIDRSYSFEDIIEAYKYVEKGHKTGNVSIRVL